VTLIYSGLGIGAIYAICAAGYNIVYSFSGIVNFAQAQYVTIGTFTAYLVAEHWNLALIPVMLIAAVVGAAAGLIQEVISIRPLAGRDGLRIDSVLITTLGWSVLIDGIAEFIFGSSTRSLPYFSSLRTVEFLGGPFLISDIVLIAAACVLCIGLYVWSRHSVVGLWSLAATENRGTAMLQGINVRRLTVRGFLIGGLILAACGPLIAVREAVTYNLGDSLVILTFVALAIGGFGNMIGGLIAGLALGIVQSEVSRYLSLSYADLVIFGILLLVLLVRPRGLIAASEQRTV
jgi:branched-chain amino acid transport system permease protein